MANDREQELERLEKELLADLQVDFSETEQPETDTPKEAEKPRLSRAEQAKKRDDKWIVILMIIACVLCLGIIGYLFYWLEVFLK